MKKYLIFIIYCNSFVCISRCLDSSISEETDRRLITKHPDVKNTPTHFGWERNFSKILVPDHQQKQATYAVHPERQSGSNVEKANKETDEQLFYNHSLEYSKKRLNNHTGQRQITENLRVKLQDNLPSRRIRPRNNCTLSVARNRQRCLRKIKKRKMKIPLNDMNNNKYYSHTIGANENAISINSPGYVKNNSSSSYKHISTDNFKPVHTEAVNNTSVLPESSSKPCKCYWAPDSCGCDCCGSLSYDDFQEISKGFFPCRKFTFSMTGGQHYALPPNLFTSIKRVEVFSLNISNCSFEYICDPTPMTSAFKGVMFSVSAIISLKNVSVKRGWNWKPFEQLQGSSGGQVNIVFEDCKLRRLTSDFSNFGKGQVDTINITHSNLEMVGSSAFGTFVNMTSFLVPDNKIKDLRRTDFPEVLPKLTEIDLRNNQLRNLDDDLFKNMPFLRKISLSGNPLIVLSEKTFHDVIGRAHLEGLSGIPLYCDCRLQWLKDSDLSSNEVTKQNMNGAICRRPSYLRGIPLEYLSKEHLICF